MQNQNGNTNAVQPVREPGLPLSMAAAKAVIDGMFYRSGGETEALSDSLMLLINGLVSHQSLLAARDHAEELLEYIYGQSLDAMHRRDEYLSGLRHKGLFQPDPVADAASAAE